jgi:mannose-6-phosphate isomerase-like protein (cupin superfamily)
MPDPIIVTNADRAQAGARLAAAGASFSIHEWRGSGPPQMHVHHEDDEAWHVLEGMLRFRFADREVEAVAGTSVFVPAGVPHTYTADGARYLVVLTPRLRDLIAELQATKDQAQHAAVYRQYASELLE